MRKLQTQDVFKVARIIKQAEIKSKITEFVAKGKEENANVEEIGIDVIMSILEACSNEKLEKAVYEFVAGVTEKTAEEIKIQSLDVTINQIKEIAKENDLGTFFNMPNRLTI